MPVGGGVPYAERVRITLALRLVGYGLLAVVAVATMLTAAMPAVQRGEWLAAYAMFAAAFHVGASAPPTGRGRRLAALAIATPAILAMGALSLVAVASQAALVLSPGQAAAWIAAQTAGVGYFLWLSEAPDDCVAALIALLGFQSFAVVAVFVARRETEARQALACANAELRATRELLAETSRVHERTRIARELHDVLGHDLTALGLQLEIATHVPATQVPEHLARARGVNTRLLHNVREVVGAIRAVTGPDLGPALRALVADLPGLEVHLAAPEPLIIDDAARAQCVLRCVQEIVTNALRHAAARNLWIAIEQLGGALHVEARDDGRGAAELAAGHGLSGMRSRLEELGGSLAIVPRPSFSVAARLPVGGAS
jgi:signal transduction histidine kinase